MVHLCQIHKRDYSEWTFVPPFPIDISPQDKKLFNEDVVIYIPESNEIHIQVSPTREAPGIPGILLLEQNRTYGRTANKKRLYYKCRPHDVRLPHFLVPFDMPMGFNKNFKNKYVTFRFDNWNEKHPYGILSQNLGDIHDFPSYCEYMLYCKQLHHPITPSIKHAKELLRKNNKEYYEESILQNPHVYGSFQTRPLNEEYIFSIDPKGCVDRDDAISITKIDNHTMPTYKVSVYIANVWVWLNALDLWKYIGDRVSTIYFPHMKRSMLPTIIGEELCSLDKDQMRFGFVLDFMVSETKPDYYEIDYESMVSHGSMHQCVLKVSENFDYQETSLLKNKHYKLLFDISKKLDKNIQDSHEMIAFWMLNMNHFCARQMKEKRIGIFRVVQSKNPMSTTQESILQKLPPFVKMLEQQLSGSYKVFDASKYDTYSHEMLGLSEYIHFTSPIRRLVDLLNQIQWVIEIIQPTALNEKIQQFFKNQISSIELINQKMKKIRRLQSECDMLYEVTHNPSILEREYIGIVLNIENNKCLIYFEELKWLTNVAIDDTMVLSKYEKLCGKLYVFEKEEQMRKKIRVQLIGSVKE